MRERQAADRAPGRREEGHRRSSTGCTACRARRPSRRRRGSAAAGRRRRPARPSRRKRGGSVAARVAASCIGAHHRMRGEPASIEADERRRTSRRSRCSTGAPGAPIATAPRVPVPSISCMRKSPNGCSTGSICSAAMFPVVLDLGARDGALGARSWRRGPAPRRRHRAEPSVAFLTQARRVARRRRPRIAAVPRRAASI